MAIVEVCEYWPIVEPASLRSCVVFGVDTIWFPRPGPGFSRAVSGHFDFLFTRFKVNGREGVIDEIYERGAPPRAKSH